MFNETPFRMFNLPMSQGLWDLPNYDLIFLYGPVYKPCSRPESAPYILSLLLADSPTTVHFELCLRAFKMLFLSRFGSAKSSSMAALGLASFYTQA